MARKSKQPEHINVRLPLIDELVHLGWQEGQIAWNPEWRVPKNPNSASKREAGESFDGYPVDIAVFDSVEHRGDYRHLLFIVETKEPKVDAGRSQLETYLSLEPHAKLGIWTNGGKRIAIFRTADGSFEHDATYTLPRPDESLLRAAPKLLTYDRLTVPTLTQLKSTLNQLLSVIVARDTKSSRRDDQLNQLCNLLLTKLESDKAGRNDPTEPLEFQFRTNATKTASRIQAYFKDLRTTHSDVFASDAIPHIHLDEDTLAEAVFTLSKYRLFDISLHLVSEAFQVFRTASLKSEEGQYFTPHAVIQSAVRFMGINQYDNVIDPACGAGGFLFEAYQNLQAVHPGMSEADQKGWAMRHLYGIDKDSINVKLTKALMIAIGDGSTNVYNADSLRVSAWPTKYTRINGKVEDEAFSCAITNPPFGKDLTFSRNDGTHERYGVCHVPVSRYSFDSEPADGFEEREIGIVFLERCFRLLRPGGKLGIILPETYFFSPSYAWLQGWIYRHFELVGVLNIPMEAFQGFCRAKTNFYVLKKLGASSGRDTLPKWFAPGKVVVINAPTCGINKDGEEQFIVDSSGTRTDHIDNRLWDAVVAHTTGKKNQHIQTIASAFVQQQKVMVPSYYDATTTTAFQSFLKAHVELKGYTLGELVAKGWISIRNGHGSPSADQRVGDVPYVKVSDLRAGSVNINPTNMIPRELAQDYWGALGSRLTAYDLISPERASKNIGEFCVLMPGQEDIVLTKEVLICRALPDAPFDQFFLMWALSLSVVRDQWRRVVFFQTNREDVGKRYLEIKIPVPSDPKVSARLATPFHHYFEGLQKVRNVFGVELEKSGFKHHIYFV